MHATKEGWSDWVKEMGPKKRTPAGEVSKEESTRSWLALAGNIRKK